VESVELAWVNSCGSIGVGQTGVGQLAWGHRRGGPLSAVDPRSETKRDKRSAPRSTLRDVSEPLNDEVLDGLPVLADEPSGEGMFPASAARASIGPLAAPAQTAVAAAGGFLAGAAVLGLVHKRKSKRLALSSSRTPRRIGRGRNRSKSAGEAVIVGSRSLLVDVHLLGAPLRGR
jgi:hypothetical protein